MYGENTRLLRDSLRELLTQHRIQQRIGGAGIHTVPETTTVTERQEIGEQIARYRHAVLVWCHQAMQAANPQINLTGTYQGGEGAILQVQRFEAGSWTDFPVTMSVGGGTFATYVLTARTGPNKFRVVDTDSDAVSNEVTVTVG